MSSPAAPVSDAEYLLRAVELATANARGSGGPFGAIVVTADGRVFEGANRVTTDLDPTAHAEVVAIRSACRALGTFDLSNATLYASCEPCPMCLATALWAHIDRVRFAADRHDAAGAGFDDALFYRYFDGAPEDRGIMPVDRIDLPGAGHTAPFIAWGQNSDRIEY